MTELIPKLSGKLPLIALVFFSMIPQMGSSTSVAEGSAYRQVCLSIIFLVSVFVLWRHAWKLLAALKVINPWLWIIFFFMALTIFWSPFPFVSIKRYIQVVGVVVVILALLVPGRYQGAISSLFRPIIIFFLVCSATVVLVKPSIGIDMYGAWRGLTIHKNQLGQIALMGIILSIMAIRTNEVVKWIGLGELLLAVIVLWFSKSYSSQLLFVLSMLILSIAFLPYLFRTGRGWMVLGAYIVSLFGVYYLYCFVLGYPSLTDMVKWLAAVGERDITFTGRTYLWKLIWHEINSHYWFGTGYGGFWLGTEGASGQLLAKLSWGPPTQAHNGYLDILNELGAVGLGLIIVLLASHGHRLFRLYRKNHNAALYHVLIFFIPLFLNFSEASLFRTTSLWWIVFLSSMIEVDFLLAGERDTPLSLHEKANQFKVR